jgi:predicted  nucleic acid-binding Zn-ribbon protein
MDKNTLDIQKEFETLISELEKLKSINEITNSNAENSKKVINEIDAFVHSIDSYKDAVDKDFQNKKQKIDQLINSLFDTSKDINKKTEQHSDELAEMLKKMNSESQKAISDKYSELSKIVNDYSSQLTEINKEINQSFQKFTTETSKKLNNQEEHFKKELQSLQESLSSIHDDIVKTFKNIEKHYTELNTFIESSQNQIIKELRDEITINRKKINRISIIMILLTVSSISLLIGLYF